jgi:nucleoside-diphosphate-sugar epimerase
MPTGAVVASGRQDRLGGGLSRVLAIPQILVHDYGRVLADLAYAVADGARVISDFRVMADQVGPQDYIHVWDLGAVHVAALTRFDTPPGQVAVINLSTGMGTTVQELRDAFNRVADRPVEAREAGPRPGNVAGANTRIDRAVRLLGWRPQYDVADGIRHSLQWAAIRDDMLPMTG